MIQELYEELFGSKIRVLLFISLVVIFGPLGAVAGMLLPIPWALGVIVIIGYVAGTIIDKILAKYDPRTDS